MNIPKLKMNSGQDIPQVGLGLWLNKEETECKDAVKWALKAGYRHFDSAQAYKNEQFLGQVVKESSVPREDMFITTKIAVDNFDKKLDDSFDQSLKNLQTDYVDLLLLHFPVSMKRQPSWPLMEELNKSGKAKSIGVSNYMISHLEELLSTCQIKPAVNQIELHVFLQMPELVKYCEKQGIIVEAYSPLSHARKMSHPVLDKLAKKYAKTNAQIMIRWCIDLGAVVLPKSTHEQRIKENFDVFDFQLNEEEMAELATLDEDLRTCWDPTGVK